MEKPYKTILEPAEDEFVEKKSRFIAYSSPVHTVEEANAFIAGIRHLWMDMDHSAVTKEFGKSSALVTLSLSILLTVVLGAKLFGLY